MKYKFRLTTFLTLLLMNLASLPKAYAALGDSGNFVARDREALSSTTQKTTKYANFSVEEFGGDSVTIREYVSNTGQVFGVAWNGRTHADLSKLLGMYATDYQNSSDQTLYTKGKRNRSVKSPSVVVQKWGHMRNLGGRAFVQQLLPEGVTANEIK